MYASAQYMNAIALSPIILTRKITYLFLTSVQLEAHSSSWQLPHILHTTISPSVLLLNSFKFLLYKGGLLSTWHINFSTSSMTDMTKDCEFVQVASNCSVASARGQAQICASYCGRQQFRYLENGSGCNFYVAATEKLQVRTLSYKAVFSIPAT
jgi:hypothetical protein